MNREIGFLFILLGFFCYFLASRMWVKANNYFRLVSEDNNRHYVLQKCSYFIGLVGLVLSSFGLMLSETIKYAFNDEVDGIQSFIETCMFFFYHSLFIWFNILVVRKYFYRYSISGEWKGNNHEIIFCYYKDYSSRGIESRGEGEFRHRNIAGMNTYKFWYSVNYNKMTVTITWVEDYRQKDEIPLFVRFGNGKYRYKMKDNDFLFLDDSIGYMKRKL